MSWIGALAGRAENILNLVDQAAGQALQKDSVEPRAFPVQWDFQHEPFEGAYASNFYAGQNCEGTASRQISLSSSVPVNLNRLNDEIVQSAQSFQQPSPPSQILTAAFDRQTHPMVNPGAIKSTKDKDEELFQFLNSPEASVKPANKSFQQNSPLNSFERSSPEKFPSSTLQYESQLQSDDKKRIISKNDPIVDSVKIPLAASRTKFDIEDLAKEKLEPNELSVEKENKFLKQEVAALTQELGSILKRNQDAQDELQTIRRQLTDKSRASKTVEELHARLADMQEALGTKDTQLAILKVRLEEANQELGSSWRSVDQLQAETQRLMRDQPSATVVSDHSCESLEVKLAEIEFQLKKEQTVNQQLQEETMEKLNALEVDKQRLCSEVGRIQRFYEEEKSRGMELQSQLKVAKSLSDTAKQDLSDYKEKAMRILQSKERLITSLKDGSLSSPANSQEMVSSTEMETVRQERDMIREELHHTRMALETAKLEITELEMQLQLEQGLLQKRVQVLEDQVELGKKRREEVDEEKTGYKQEITKLQSELQKQTSALQSRIDDRDEEIHRLRSQVTMKNLSGSSHDELESRLHSLTESLIQKQTILEALSTEKNSLVLQLERMEKHYQEAEAEAIRASAALAGVQGHQEARHRVPGILRESPADGEIARQVKHAANVLDRFSIRLGVFLKHFPIARIFVILYMVILHLWVFVVLMTYQHEIHSIQSMQPPGSQ